MKKKELTNAINFLKNNQGYRQNSGEGMVGFYDYAKEIYSLEKLVGKELLDKNYNLNIKNVKILDIAQMQLDNIKTYLTFIFRGERFCEGHIAMHIDDGTLLKLLERALELS